MSALPFVLRLTCCCCCWFTCIVILLRSSCNATELIGSYSNIDVNEIDTRQRRSEELLRATDNDYQKHQRQLVTTHSEDTVYDDDTDMSYDGDDDDEDYLDKNTTEKGSYVGAPCEDTCNADLQHVICDAITGLCECEKQYPVRLGPTRGCAKIKRLGEQCFYRATCVFADQHATCTQVQHNAVCDCEEGYHRVAIARPSKRVFCAEDLVLITADMPTLLGIASGIAVLTGLICFVLKLFSRARYTRPRHYADAHHAPNMLFSSDTGIPLTLSGRPSSRSSQRSEGGTINCETFGRRPSSGGSRGPIVPASRAGAARAAAILLISCHLQAEAKGGNAGNKHRRALSDVAEGSSDGLGSRRPSLASIHSSASSARSYSARRLERERNEKEQRQALQELKLAKHRENNQSQSQQQQQQQQLQQQQQQNAPIPSPRTPHSTDELLPSVEEDKEAFDNEIATTSGMTEATLPKRTSITVATTAVLASTSSSMKNNMAYTNETAFNSSTGYTSAFNNDTRTVGNCSNVVDIFES